MTQKNFNDQDEQAAWELIARHKSIEPSFGFAQRVLRRLDEVPATVRPAWWSWPSLRWATGFGFALIVAFAGAVRCQQVRDTRRLEVYTAAHQDSLEDFDVIAALDQLNGETKL